MSRPNYNQVTIIAGGTKSQNPTKLIGQQIVGFITPASLISTSITFNMSPGLDTNPIVYYPIKNSATSTTFTVTTSTYYGFTQDQVATFSGVEDIQVVCGSTETNGAIITLVLIPRIT